MDLTVPVEHSPRKDEWLEAYIPRSYVDIKEQLLDVTPLIKIPAEFCVALLIMINIAKSAYVTRYMSRRGRAIMATFFLAMLAVLDTRVRSSGREILRDVAFFSLMVAPTAHYEQFACAAAAAISCYSQPVSLYVDLCVFFYMGKRSVAFAPRRVQKLLFFIYLSIAGLISTIFHHVVSSSGITELALCIGVVYAVYTIIFLHVWVGSERNPMEFKIEVACILVFPLMIDTLCHYPLQVEPNYSLKAFHFLG